MNSGTTVRWLLFVSGFALSSAIPTSATAEKKAGTASNAELVKKAQNPVADMMSFPFQNNVDFGVGPAKQVANTLNVQPVIPIGLGPVNLITRTILPIVSRPSGVTSTGNNEFGLGDMTATIFAAPSAPGPVIWGVGPVFYFPTATSEALGTAQFGVGPSFVVLGMPGDFVVGVLFNHIWSFAGKADRTNVNQTLVQYFINYNLPNQWFITIAPILTGNWEIETGNKWTVPFGGGIGKLFRIGKLPINTTIQAYGNVVKPTGAADATLRIQIQFILPNVFS